MKLLADQATLFMLLKTLKWTVQALVSVIEILINNNGADDGGGGGTA